MAGFSSVVLMGNMTNDPELKMTTTGKSVCTFTVAVNRFTRGTTRADFWRVEAWGSTAEFISRNFRKGAQIIISGELMTDSYTDKNGVERTAPKIKADKASFCGKKDEMIAEYSEESAASASPSADSGAPQYAPPGAETGFVDVGYEDDLPF